MKIVSVAPPYASVVVVMPLLAIAALNQACAATGSLIETSARARKESMALGSVASDPAGGSAPTLNAISPSNQGLMSLV